MTRQALYVLFIILMAVCVTTVTQSCKKKVNPTTVEVEDQDRHYYPIMQGQELDLNYGLTNVGEDPLVITEIQTSCGCMVVNDDLPIVIMPDKKDYIHVKYNSTKNIGLVKHYIYCYGNVGETGMVELRFDVNVVPNADYTRDYEELFREHQDRSTNLKDAVDGNPQRTYFVDGEDVK